ncbi:FkbM family methyltransferase [Hyphomicrobium denitrificans]|nr:FkbM family methyltransferase [Hyphomicrobium denitrificans]
MTLHSTFRTAARTTTPFALWQTLGFVKRIPSYWRLDRSEALRIRNRTPGLPLYVKNGLTVFPPESVTAYLNWQHHGIEINESSVEAREFLELSKNRMALIDIGAQTGFMSALFARSRPHACHILSVEPDPQVLPLLERAIALNTGPHIDWKIMAVAVSDMSGRLIMPISNRLHEHAMKAFKASDVDVPVTTLSDLLTTIDWQPDIMKIDVESFEHEVLCSSLLVIERLKPALQLEVHWQMLERRGRNAIDFLEPLASIGYRGLRRQYRDLHAWMRAGRSEAVSRLAIST